MAGHSLSRFSCRKQNSQFLPITKKGSQVCYTYSRGMVQELWLTWRYWECTCVSPVQTHTLRRFTAMKKASCQRCERKLRKSKIITQKQNIQNKQKINKTKFQECESVNCTRFSLKWWCKQFNTLRRKQSFMYHTRRFIYKGSDTGQITLNEIRYK